MGLSMRELGLRAGLSAALKRWRPGRTFHDWGKIVTDLAVAVALGGDYLADARYGALDDQCGHPSALVQVTPSTNLCELARWEASSVAATWRWRS
jgi:hypothetical protein